MEENESAPSPEARYPLAFDGNGNPIELSPEAVAWRVRRGGGRRGRPRHVFDSETGRQLEIPLTAGIDTLIDAGCAPDRYLLYPVDGEGHVIAGIIAVTEVSDSDGEGKEAAVTVGGEQSALIAVVTHQLATIKEQSQTLCRALEATTSGYGRVRPSEPPPQPIVLQRPEPSPPEKDGGAGGLLAGITPDQIGQLLGYAKLVYDMIRGGATPTVPAGAPFGAGVGGGP
jgi:hypothetical protein